MDEETKNTTNKREYTDETGKFAEGNPGRPKGSKNKFSIAKLEEAIAAEEKEVSKQKGFGVPVFQQFIRMAYREPSVMIALMRKFVPDLEKTELTGNLHQRIDLSGLNIEELKALAYEYTIKNKSSTDKGDTKAGKDRTGP